MEREPLPTKEQVEAMVKREAMIERTVFEPKRPLLPSDNIGLIDAAPDLLAALESLFEHCEMVHRHWGEGSNKREADAAIAAGRAAIAKAKGETT